MCCCPTIVNVAHWKVCERVPSVGMIGRGAAAIRPRADVGSRKNWSLGRSEWEGEWRNSMEIGRVDLGWP